MMRPGFLRAARGKSSTSQDDDRIRSNTIGIIDIERKINDTIVERNSNSNSSSDGSRIQHRVNDAERISIGERSSEKVKAKLVASFKDLHRDVPKQGFLRRFFSSCISDSSAPSSFRSAKSEYSERNSCNSNPRSSHSWRSNRRLSSMNSRYSMRNSTYSYATSNIDASDRGFFPDPSGTFSLSNTHRTSLSVPSLRDSIQSVIHPASIKIPGHMAAVDESSQFSISENFLLPSTTDAASYRLDKNTRPELGYLRIPYVSREAAMYAVRETGKPLVTIRVERPGHLQAGVDVFSHPLIVEALETQCVLLLEKPDWELSSLAPAERTRLTFQSYNPTSCVLDEAKSILKGQSLTRYHVLVALIDALRPGHSSHEIIPRYLLLLKEEEREGCRRSTCILGSKYPLLCEVALADIEGVLATRVGTFTKDDKKVNFVEVTHDACRLSFGKLIREAFEKLPVSTFYFKSNEERQVIHMELSRQKDSHGYQVSGAMPDMDYVQLHETKHALRQTPLKFVPMTALQATRTNRYVHLGKFNEATALLSPRQGVILMKAVKKESWNVMIEVPILDAWLIADGNLASFAMDDNNDSGSKAKNSDSSSEPTTTNDDEYRSYEYEKMPKRSSYFHK